MPGSRSASNRLLQSPMRSIAQYSQEILGGTNPVGDVQQDVTDGRIAATSAQRVHDRAHLLVAGPREAQFARHVTDGAVRVGDRSPWIVESVHRGDQALVDPRRSRGHAQSVAPRAMRDVQRSEARHRSRADNACNRLLQGEDSGRAPRARSTFTRAVLACVSWTRRRRSPT